MSEPLCLSRLCELELRAEQTAAQRKHGAEPPFTLAVGEVLSLIAQARRCAEAERAAKRLWLREAVTDRLLTLCDTREFSLCRALRLTKRVPVPVVVDTDMGFGDTGVTIDPAAGDRLFGFVDELVDLLTVERSVVPRSRPGRAPAPPNRCQVPKATTGDP